jgi:hypothetical protein
MRIKFFFLLAVIATLFQLTGCATKPVYSQLQVQETKVIKEKLPPSLLTACLPKAPVTKELYMAYKPYEREQYLADYVVNLLGSLKDCDNKISKIRELSSD